MPTIKLWRLMVLCVVAMMPAPSQYPSVHNQLSAQTWYVAANGDDRNPGTAEQPFATPQHAIDVAVPGDTVHVGSGTYRARLQFPRSGAPGKPITLEGDNALIDAGEEFGGWRTAPEVGPGVFKRTHLPYTPYTMLWNNQYILRIRDDVMPTQGFRLLRDGPEGFYTWDGPLQRSWDGIEALWGTVNDVTYLRLRDGQNPNTQSISVSPYAYQGGAPITIDGQSHITIRGFTLRNGNIGVYIINGANNIIVENNLITGHHDGVGIYDQANSVVVRNNRITLGYVHSLDPNDPLHWFIWYNFKNISDYDRTAILSYNAGGNNQIYNNTIYEHWNGVASAMEEGNASTPQNNTIYNNVFDRMSDDCYEPGGNEQNEQFYDNTMQQCNIAVRLKAGDQARLYVYRNVVYAAGCTPSGENKGIFISQDTKASMYFYHNSISACTTIQYTDVSQTGAPNIWYVNNVFSSINFGRPTNRGAPPHFDYNWVSGDDTKQPWMGDHNRIALDARIWGSTDPNLFPSVDSPVRGLGIDLSRAVMVDDAMIGPLPGLQRNYFMGIRPDLGARQFGIPSAGPPVLRAFQIFMPNASMR